MKKISTMAIIFLMVLSIFPIIALKTKAETISNDPTAGPLKYTVFATQLGLVGGTTANGHVIQPHDHFVALPSTKALSSKDGHEYEVRITYRGKSVVAPVWDVGPWNELDNYWYPDRNTWGVDDYSLTHDFPVRGVPMAQTSKENGWHYGYTVSRGRPADDGWERIPYDPATGNLGTQREVLNSAGIDLADGIFEDLEMSDNDWVTVEFLWTAIYAGGSGPGVVYRYLGDADWEVISPELGYAVMSLTEFDGYLYAGVTTGYGGYAGSGRVYRYDGDNVWAPVGDGMDHAVISLAVYQGNLYAGTGRGGFRLYKYTPGMTNCGIEDWTKVVDYGPWEGVRSLHVSHDYLLMGDSIYDRIGRWDGSNFHVDLDDGGSCIYDFQDYGGCVYAAAYDGRLWRSTDAIHWSVALGYYDGNMWELEEFRDKLYMSYNNGELRAYDGTGSLRGELVYTAPDGIISMTTYGDNLYFGTGGDAVGYGPESSGIASVYRYDGTNVVRISNEDEMQTGVQVLYAFALPPEDQPPTCVIKLQKEGVEINEIDVGQFFDIYVGDSTDDTGIKQVRFSSDDLQDGNPTGEWTEWYNWDISSGDWDASTKIKRWAFATGGAKEVWAEVKDDIGQTDQDYANIFVHPGYAIIVAGKGRWWAWKEDLAICHCANNAYRTLRNLGFNDDHIYYLNSKSPQDIDGDGNNEVDALASLSDFENVLNEIRAKTENNLGLLIVYLVGHGVQDAFLFDGDSLHVSKLKYELDKFSSQTRMLIMINSCYSGSFITPTYPDQSISAANRIIITTTHNDQKRYAFVWVRSSDRFWGGLNKGLNVKEAFTYRPTPGDNSHMWLDDNADKIGHPPNDLQDDGELAATTKIGLHGTENLALTPWQLIWKHSPGELRVYDSQNRVTGLVNGEIKEEIPNSIYDEENEIVAIFSPSDTYHYEVVGTEEETYGLEIAFINGSEAVTFNATDIPTSTNATHQYTVDWDALSVGEEGVTVMVDSDGDGMFEHTFSSDSVLSHGEYLAAIHACNTWITDSDFNEIESFRVVFTPDRSTGRYKLTATNPGQFYFNILVNNTWSEPLNLTIAYLIDANFRLKGARPIHVYADLERTIDITADCTFSGNTITVYNVDPNDIVYVTIHLDYALKGTTWTKGEVEAWYSEHGFNATVRSITSQVVITDPAPQQPPIPLSLIFLIVIVPMIILCLGLILLLKYAPLIAAKCKED